MRTAVPPHHLLWVGDCPVVIADEPASLAAQGMNVTHVPRLGTVRLLGPQTEHESGPRSLSADDLQRLAHFDYSRRVVTSDIAERTRRAFDSVVVSDDVPAFNNVLRSFPRKVVLRSYGAKGPVGSPVWEVAALTASLQRKDVYVCSFSRAALANEHMLNVYGLAKASPYYFNPALAPYRGVWSRSSSPLSLRGRGRILFGYTHTGDGRYDAAYDRLSTIFSEELFRRLDDATYETRETYERDIPRRIAQLQSAAGYLYPYVGETQIYPGAVEMLVIGGPLVYFANSALAALVGPGGPGEADTLDKAIALCRALYDGDRELIAEMRAAQLAVCDRLDARGARPEAGDGLKQLLLLPETNRYPRSPETGLSPERRDSWRQRKRLLRALTANIASSDGPEPEWIVETFYQLVLERDPDPQGLAHHANRLRQGVPPVAMLSDFLKSDEAAAKRGRGAFWETLGWSGGLATEQ